MPAVSRTFSTEQSRRAFLAGAALFGAGALGACSTKTRSGGGGGGGRSGSSADKLFIAGFQWGAPTSFSPFASAPGWPSGQNSAQYLYETLVRFNLLNGKLEPGLATGLKWPDSHTVVASLQGAAHWQDGKRLTADDVVYTFELAKRHSEVSYATFWSYVGAVSKKDDHTVAFTVKNPLNPKMVLNYLATTWILPQHVWSKQEDNLDKFTNDHPVGSGPYQLGSFNQQQVILNRYDNYWGKSFYKGLPPPSAVVHPIFKSNDDGDLAFEQGDVDVSQQFTPQIWKMWQTRHLPVSTWFDKPPYHVPGSIPMLVVNTTKKGLDNVKVRHAIAYAIDYAHIAATAMSKYSVPANSSLVLPTGSESAYFNKENVAKHGWTYDPKKAKSILEDELHAKKGSDGIYRLPDGTRLGPWTAQTPTGWSDWQSGLQTVSASAKAVGIDITTNFPQAPQVTSAVQNGDFDLACWYVSGVSAASPWQRFRDVLDNRGVPGLGKAAFYNYGRFQDSAVHDLLDRAAAATSKGQAKELYTELDTIFMKNAPMIPLMYRPLEFYEYNASTWTGFPNAKHPTAPPMFQGAGNTWLFGLKHT